MEAGSMHPYRIAILIFLIGASVVNVLAAKMQRDRLTYPYNPAHAVNSWVSTPNPAATIDWSTIYDPNNDPAAQKRQQLNIDVAWTREAAIVTIAGVGWFLVKAKV